MDGPEGQQWYLRKHEEGEVFGPLPFEQLARWAAAAQVAPHDLVSSDGEAWMKAPMLPQLGMDWLVELTAERFYGPTTLGAVQEFIRLGEIDDDTFIINSCDGTRRQIREMPALVQPHRDAIAAERGFGGVDVTGPPVTGRAIDSRARVRELEQALNEERRALQQAEERYRALEAKYRALGGSDR